MISFDVELFFLLAREKKCAPEKKFFNVFGGQYLFLYEKTFAKKSAVY